MFASINRLPRTDRKGEIAEALRKRGYAMLRDYIAPERIRDLRHVCRILKSAMETAGTGYRASGTAGSQVRLDRLYRVNRWGGPLSEVRQEMESLRQFLNRQLYLGLGDFDANFTYYPAGAYYRTHLDQLRGSQGRELSASLYLNDCWTPADGGALRLYSREDDGKVIEEILPEAGTLVLFLSAEFPHEVLPTSRPRYSLSGWFLSRSHRASQQDNQIA